jgi:hypothetical protein
VFRRSLLTGIALTLLPLGVSAVPASATPAQASLQQPASQTQPLLECTGYETSQYQPGITVVPRQVEISVSGALGPCVGLPLDHTTGTYSFTGNGRLSCIYEEVQGGGRIDWTNPQNSFSTFVVTGAISLRPGGLAVIILTGEIVTGDFQGSTLISEFILAPGPAQTLECLSPQGVTTVSGPFSIQIL